MACALSEALPPGWGQRVDPPLLSERAAPLGFPVPSSQRDWEHPGATEDCGPVKFPFVRFLISSISSVSFPEVVHGKAFSTEFLEVLWRPQGALETCV